MKIDITLSAILDTEETLIIRDCLRYCRHRKIFHPECGAKYLNLKGIEKLIKELDNLDNKIAKL